jgi:hypothetical protein
LALLSPCSNQTVYGVTHGRIAGRKSAVSWLGISEGIKSQAQRAGHQPGGAGSLPRRNPAVHGALSQEPVNFSYGKLRSKKVLAHFDGKIDDEFWSRKMNEWQEQERELESELSSLKVLVTTESVLTVNKDF